MPVEESPEEKYDVGILCLNLMSAAS